ncbi:LOW QUALITY PROTEIN: reverse transcriptase [Phytophthora palmivora]|uniref:Reverse transcriptase n=1 Tax=Phytophthora palmivora TaxID=4796 RepID=A0A2P4XA04_9STRA|nr:LOW QUALITY PROTEIN: reverse transcriptase [Phytophthora palmivora]
MRYLQVTNVSDRALTLHEGSRVAMWLSGDRIPRIPGYVSVGSRRYAEWQNLAYQARTDEISEVDINEQIIEPAARVCNTDRNITAAGVVKIVKIVEDEDVILPSGKCIPDPGKIDPVNSNDTHTKIEMNIGDGRRSLRCGRSNGCATRSNHDHEEVNIEYLQVGDTKINTQEEIERLVQIIRKRKHLLIGKGMVLPPAAKGVVCDIDVGNAKPQRFRKMAIQFREKLFQLIKRLLSARIIRHSTSPWASPIVVIIKKNGIDIRVVPAGQLRVCLENSETHRHTLINNFLDDLDKVLWYCSLNMVSDFWVVPMPDRARAISAFITPFGPSEWNRMPFGLKTPPQIYQILLDNALYGLQKVTQDQDRPDRSDVFETGEPDLEKNASVLGRRSYIDDILVTGRSWDALCEKVKKLLDTCDEWNLFISVAKSFWGRQKVDYLGHRVSADDTSKRFVSFTRTTVPTNPRSMQSFNYYSRFIEDFAIYASVLYELREADFYEIARKIKSTGDDEGVVAEEDGRWTEAKAVFPTLKNKIVNAPILQHFDVDRQPVVVVYASKWAIPAALMQEHDGVYKPVIFTSRTLKPNEINYGMVDKEVLALLRILNICYTQLATRSIKVLTRHSTLAWLLHSSGLQGRLGRWAALLSSWTLEIVKCTRGEDEILGVIAASITPRREVDSILISIAPRKQPRQVISMPPPTVEPGERLLVVSFDGSARVNRSGGACSGIVWSLPEWTVISAASEYKLDLTVNEAEYHGLLLCLDLLSDMDRGRLIICGD